MKWLLMILIVVVAGWKAAVYLTNNSKAPEVVTYSSPTGVPAIDSTLKDSTGKALRLPDATVTVTGPVNQSRVDTSGVQPQRLVAFAKTLIGTPYLYGSVDPAKGFDCSGFITYVFNHFGLAVPRSSIEFTNFGKDIKAVEARAGDLILFTGTDSSEKFVGHMGIVVENTDTLRFIHATSGKQYGVTITPLSNYYKGRFVKTIRVF